MQYLGDFKKDAVVYHMWETTTASGSAANPSDYGTMIAYKNDGTSESETGITVAEAFDGFAGIHNVKVDTSNAFYTIGSDYSIIASGMVVDNTNVNAVICQFSLENRFNTDALQAISGDINVLQGTIDTVSGDINNGITVSGITAEALSQIVASGDAATAGTGWGATSTTTQVTVSGHTPGALSEIIASGNAAEWNQYSDATLANQTTIVNNLSTTSGNITDIQNTLITISGDIADGILVSGLTPEALSQIVTSGNADGWNSNTVQVTVSGLTPGALSQIVASGDASDWYVPYQGITVSGFTAPSLTQLVTSGNAANWNTSTALSNSDINWIASGVWRQDLDNGDFITSGLAGQKFTKLFSTFMYSSQIIPSGNERYMSIYNNNTPVGTPISTFKLYNFAGGNPTISPQTITGRNRIST